MSISRKLSHPSIPDITIPGDGIVGIHQMVAGKPGTDARHGDGVLVAPGLGVADNRRDHAASQPGRVTH